VGSLLKWPPRIPALWYFHLLNRQIEFSKIDKMSLLRLGYKNTPTSNLLVLSSSSGLLTVMKPTAEMGASPLGGPYGMALRVTSGQQPARKWGLNSTQETEPHQQLCEWPWQRIFLQFKPEMTVALANTWTAAYNRPYEIQLNHSTIPEPLNLQSSRYCFKPLRFGIICYAVIDK
jgi:hypothetical protein